MVSAWRRRCRRPDQSGYVLLLALFVTIIALAAGALTAQALHLRMQLVRQQERDLRLTALLDAAMAQAMAELVRDANYEGTDGAQALGNGTYEINARREGSNRVFVGLRVVYGGIGRGALATLELYPVLKVQSWQIEPYDPRAGDHTGVHEPQL